MHGIRKCKTFFAAAEGKRSLLAISTYRRVASEFLSERGRWLSSGRKDFHCPVPEMQREYTTRGICMTLAYDNGAASYE